MEDRPVVETLVHVLEEVLHADGGSSPVEFQNDVSLGSRHLDEYQLGCLLVRRLFRALGRLGRFGLVLPEGSEATAGDGEGQCAEIDASKKRLGHSGISSLASTGRLVCKS